MNRPLPHRPLPISLAIALTLGSSAAQALGLGGITVKSELNEPLRAEIPVFVAGPEEAKTLNASLAAAEEFARVGLSIGSMSVPISFDIVRNARGEPVIEVTSEQPVREPFLSFILEVNWANGKLLREYSILLDPPVSAPAVIGSLAAVERLPEQETMPAEPLEPIAEAPPMAATESASTEPAAAESAAEEPLVSEPLPEPAPVSEQPAEPLPETLAEQPAEPTAEPTAESSSEPVPDYLTEQPHTEPTADTDAAATADATAATEPAPEPMQPTEPQVAEPPMSSTLAASEYGPVASGETLWEIATTTRPNEAVTLNQMMLALLRANPQAFYQDNVNTLRRGAILRIPGPEEIEATRAAQASAEVLNQNRTWIESTRPTMVADASSSSFSPGTGSSPSGSTASSRLELVPPASGGMSGSDRPGNASGTANAATTAELARTKEALNSTQSEARDLRERVKELEGLSGKSERLIELKDSELKAMQDRLAAAEKRAIDAAAALAAAKGDAAAARRIADEAAASAKAAEEAQRQADARAAEAAAATPEPAVADVSPAITDTAPTSDPMASAEPLDTTTDASAVDSSAADPTATTDDAASQEPVAETEVPPADAEVVPLAESEPVDTTPAPAVSTEEPAKPWYQNIYILGGGGLLIAALGALGLVSRNKRKASEKPIEPRSSIAHNFAGGIAGAANKGGDSVETDLLNALALDPTDLNAHLNVLEYFYTRRDPDKFEAAAEAMHAQVSDPNAAEWQGALLMGADICPTHPLFSSMNPDAHGTSNLHDPFAAGNFDLHQPPAPPAKDSGFGRKDMPTPKATPAVPAETFDFDLVMDKKGGAKKPSDELSLDFDFDLDSAASVPSSKLDVPSLEIPNLDFSTSAKAASAMESTQQMSAISADFLGDDAVATKIDLARAYLDMGDSDGARSMLEEVMTEGNVGQRDEAKKLLSEIR